MGAVSIVRMKVSCGSVDQSSGRETKPNPTHFQLLERERQTETERQREERRKKEGRKERKKERKKRREEKKEDD